MNTIVNKKKIIDVLQQTQNVQFAYLFGSVVKGKTRLGSDLDIAVYFKSEPQLLEIGSLVSKLEKATDYKIDLISLNDLYDNNSKLAYSVISEGILLFRYDNKLLTYYKKMVFLKYLDFKPVIDLFNRKLNERIAKNKFAVVEK